MKTGYYCFDVKYNIANKTRYVYFHHYSAEHEKSGIVVLSDKTKLIRFTCSKSQYEMACRYNHRDDGAITTAPTLLSNLKRASL